MAGSQTSINDRNFKSMIFTSEQESHNYSLQTLKNLSGHYEFKTSIKNIIDIGCGREHFDLKFWASLTNDEDDGSPGAPLNISCTGLDKLDIKENPNYKNIKLIQRDFNKVPDFGLDEKFDVVWCSDAMQYSHSPLNFLKNLNGIMQDNGMLYLRVPSTISVIYNKFQNYTKSGYYSTFTLTQLIYLLALNGFDCNDVFFKKTAYEDIIEVVTYKISEPYDSNLNWGQLAEHNMLTDNMNEIINHKGYLTDQGLITKWIDGSVFDYRWHT